MRFQRRMSTSDQIIVLCRNGKRAAHLKGAPVRFLQKQFVANIGKGNKAFQNVIAIIAPPQNLQTEIDFRRSGKAQHQLYGRAAARHMGFRFFLFRCTQTGQQFPLNFCAVFFRRVKGQCFAPLIACFHFALHTP